MLWDFAHDVYVSIWMGIVSLATTVWFMAGTAIAQTPTWLSITVASLCGISGFSLLSTRRMCSDGKVRLGWHILLIKAASLALFMTLLAVPAAFSAAILWFVIV